MVVEASDTVRRTIGARFCAATADPVLGGLRSIPRSGRPPVRIPGRGPPRSTLSGCAPTSDQQQHATAGECQRAGDEWRHRVGAGAGQRGDRQGRCRRRLLRRLEAEDLHLGGVGGLEGSRSVSTVRTVTTALLTIVVPSSSAVATCVTGRSCCRSSRLARRRSPRREAQERRSGHRRPAPLRDRRRWCSRRSSRSRSPRPGSLPRRWPRW